VLPRAEDRPSWVAEARSLPLLAAGADWLRRAVPEDLLKRAGEGAGSAAGAASDAGSKALFDSLLAPPTGEAPANQAVSDAGSGYNDADRAGIDKLVKTAQ
jgi:hypothetical protein